MYPSTIAALANPQATDRLNSPSHSGIEQAQNTNITAIENFIGTEGSSSAVGTLIYDVRSPASDGGGHVQAASKGGTGQTQYAKGDLLVGQSNSVLTRLVIGSDNQVLQANSSAAAGINWINNPTPKVIANASIFAISGGGDTSIMTATLPASTLGTSNVVIGKTFINASDIRSSVIVKGMYGGTVVTSVVASSGLPGVRAVTGTVTHTLIGNNSDNSARSYLEVTLESVTPDFGARTSIWSFYDTNITSVGSGASQTFGATAQTVASGDVVFGGYIIQKIV